MPLADSRTAALAPRGVGAQAAFCPPECSLGVRVRPWGPVRWSLSSLGSCALAGRPALKAALALPAARRPGLSHNPHLEAEALSWPPPTGGIKAAAVLVAPSLVYLLTCTHPSGTTSSFESALRVESTLPRPASPLLSPSPRHTPREQAPPASTPPEAQASYREQTRFLPS